MEKHYLTPEGKAQLEEKLKYYKTVKRPDVIKRIGIAREFGDLSENSEYMIPCVAISSLPLPSIYISINAIIFIAIKPYVT